MPCRPLYPSLPLGPGRARPDGPCESQEVPTDRTVPEVSGAQARTGLSHCPVPDPGDSPDQVSLSPGPLNHSLRPLLRQLSGSCHQASVSVAHGLSPQPHLYVEVHEDFLWGQVLTESTVAILLDAQSGSPAQVTAFRDAEKDSSGTSPPAAFPEELPCKSQPAGSYQQISCLDSVIRCGRLPPPPRRPLPSRLGRPVG